MDFMATVTVLITVMSSAAFGPMSRLLSSI